MKLIYSVPDTASGMRLDKYLGTIPEVQSRSRALQLIEAGSVLIFGKIAKASLSLKGGEEIQVEIPEPPSLELQPLNLALEILFEDEHLIVLNKPPGLVVHPAAGHAQDTLVNALIAHTHNFSMKFGENRPGIVHRLDKDTSGVMVVAKTDAVQLALTQQFKNRTIQRHYLAIVCGSVPTNSGTIKSFLARHPSDRKRFASLRDSNKKIIREPLPKPEIGKWAHTEYQVLARHNSGLSYLRLKLQTGRTHQIRVHLSELGYPILGDHTYGANKKYRAVPRFALHAAKLGFVHPIFETQVSFETPWPLDYSDLVLELFGNKNDKN